ncbi:FecR domain-containing protein [Myxococcaceae bacterium GXIMD 01537]
MTRHESEALWALAADELEGEARARVEAHVAACAECAQALAQVRQTRALLREAGTESPAVHWAEVDEHVLGTAARRFARLERAPRWPWALAAAGACAAVLAFALLRPVAAPPVEPPAIARAPEAPSAPEPPAIQVESALDAWGREGAGELALQPGTRLHAGASVRTPARASALLRLPDASRVRVAPGSEVVLARAEAKDVHLTVKSGRLAVQASHERREGFLVEAAGVRVSVVGTVFAVENAPRGVSVAVLEGKVRVDVEGQPPRFLSAGERLDLRPGDENVARARPLSAQDHQGFQGLGIPASQPVPQPRPAARPDSTVAARPVAPPPAPIPSPATPPEGIAETPTLVEAPPLPTPVAPEPEPDFAPYPPAPPSQAQAIVAPSPAGVGDAFVPRNGWAPQPNVALPRGSDQRFLQHARAQLKASTCESFLAGLAEIAERSPVREFREQARYLRARCFEEKLAPQAASAEYQRYLREFPRGQYVEEARAALLP